MSNRHDHKPRTGGSNNNQVFDMEHCLLFLAANLLVGGTSALEKQLKKHQHASSSPDPSSFSSSSSSCSLVRSRNSCWPLYWRSPLLLDPNSIDLSTVMPTSPHHQITPSSANNESSRSRIRSTTITKEDEVEERKKKMELDVVFVDVTFWFAPPPPLSSSSIRNDTNCRQDQ